MPTNKHTRVFQNCFFKRIIDKKNKLIILTHANAPRQSIIDAITLLQIWNIVTLKTSANLKCIFQGSHINSHIMALSLCASCMCDCLICGWPVVPYQPLPPYPAFPSLPLPLQYSCCGSSVCVWVWGALCGSLEPCGQTCCCICLRLDSSHLMSL